LDFIQTVLAFVVTLGILVTIHEWGHFYVARLCGVKVLRFSVGFGKVFYSRKDKQGTEFALAAIPLGGYVKMLDEREGVVEGHQKQQAFNNKNVWQRIAIVAAGPLVNLLFAVLAYWVLFVSGINTVVPVVGGVVKDSIAEQMQLPVDGEVVSVDGQKVESWQDINLALARRVGETGNISIQVKGGANQEPFSIRNYSASLYDWKIDLEKQSPLSALGLLPYRPVVMPVLANIQEQGAAKRAGLEVGDKIIAIQAMKIETWAQLVNVIKGSNATPLEFTVERAAKEIKISITPEQKTLESGQKIGFIGVGVQRPEWPKEMLRTQQLNLFDGLVAAGDKTWKMISLTLDSIKKMVVGVISVKNLSGPITIAKVASASAQSGFEAYIGFLAYLSISLGILNLLPIPMLDGGHLFYYVIEAIKGKPVPDKVQNIGLRIGMALLFSMMAIAIFNDVMRL
jgi:regulator of sigma E protease